MYLIPSRIYRFAEYELSSSSRLLLRSGVPVPLGSKSFDVLACLLAHAGEVVSKQELLKTVWPESFVEESNLTQHIFGLRRAFGEGSDFIRTVSGRGYQFTQQVEVEDAPATVSSAAVPTEVVLQNVKEKTRILIEEEEARQVSPMPAARRRNVWPYAAAAVALAALCGWGVWAWVNRAVPGDHHEIVLADFDNASGDPELTHPLQLALAIDLKQSPYLSISADAKVAATLKLMEQSAKTSLTLPLAREVCQRLGDQAVLSGSVTAFGRKYLVTLVASDCGSGKNLAESKDVAGSREDILQSIDSVAAQMRKRLGEPLNSVRRFQQPLLPKATTSLEALQFYSRAHDLGMAGQFPASIPLFQRAIELDPQFAVAHADLGVVYGNLGESSLAAQELKKAYDGRDLADEKDRLFIISAYNDFVTGDVNEAIRNYRTWTDIYPDATTAWANLANLENQVGQYDEAIGHASHALHLDPESPFPYIMLSRAQLASGHLEDAKATCRLAISRKLDVAELRGVLLMIAFVQHDGAAVDEQIAWGNASASKPYMTLQEALMNFAEGRPKAALALFDQLTDGYRKQGLAERANRMSAAIPRVEVLLGDTEDAKRRLKEISAAEGSTDLPVALAQVGETAQAEALLDRQMQSRPTDVLWKFFRGPQIVAAIDLSRDKPGDALAVLQTAVPYDLRSSELFFQRGQAYLAAHQPALAAAEFQKIVDRPGLEPLSPDHPLALLGLARAYAAEGNFPASRGEYEAFFSVWKDAEPDVPVLRAARSEYGQLPR